MTKVATTPIPNVRKVIENVFNARQTLTVLPEAMPSKHDATQKVTNVMSAPRPQIVAGVPFATQTQKNASKVV